MTDTATRADWLQARRNGIGASDVAGILNLSPWASPFSVWASKVDPVNDNDDTPAMEFGRRAEIMVAPWFTERTGLHVIGEQTHCAHPDAPWMRCTVDGMVVESPNSGRGDVLGVLEIKTTSDTADEWATNGVPVHYQCQATWAMAVTGTDHCWFAVLHLAFGRPEFAAYDFRRDLDEEAFVVDRVAAFWRDHVLTGTPPAVDAHHATTDAVKAHWPTAEGTLEADDGARLLVARLRAHKATAARLAEHIEAAENELRALLGDREALVDGESVIASWKQQTAERLDTRALKIAHPTLAAEFTNTTTTRVLRVPKLKED